MGFLSMSQFREYCNGLTDTKDFPDKTKEPEALISSKQGMRESNSHQRFWRPLSYHLTNPLYRGLLSQATGIVYCDKYHLSRIFHLFCIFFKKITVLIFIIQLLYIL